MLPIIEIEYPFYLLFLIVIPILFVLKRHSTKIGLVFSSLIFFNNVKPTLKSKVYPILFYINVLVIVLIIISLSKPYVVNYIDSRNEDANDVMFVLDISGSMHQNNGTKNINKINLSRNIIKEIISKREKDNFGLIVFSKDALTLSPLTRSKNIFFQFLIQDYNNFIEDGTALGNAIVSAVNRIKMGEAKNKHIFIFTDGLNNTGEIDPLLAAQLANKYNTKIHSIDLNINQEADLLKTISANTKGLYFNIRNGSINVWSVFEDSEESTFNLTSTVHKNYLHEYILLISLILLIIETTLHFTYLRRLV